MRLRMLELLFVTESIDSWFFLSFPAVLILMVAGLEKRRKNTWREMSSALILDRLSDADFGKILTNVSTQFAASANRRFEFHKCR
jgi:hypothetical protein